MSKHAIKQSQYELGADAAPEQHGAHEFNPVPEAVAARAYELWRRRGCPEGSPEIDWFQAERELKPRRAGPFVG